MLFIRDQACSRYAALMPVRSSEYIDFRNFLRQLGYKETDFQIAAERDDPVPAGGAMYAENGTITIRYMVTGIERIYRTGIGTHWVVDFARDLEQGKFKERG